MKKRTAYRMAMILCASFFLSGCGLFPFQQDVPFLSERADNKGADSESTGSGTQETFYGNGHDVQGQVSEDSEESESQTNFYIFSNISPSAVPEPVWKNQKRTVHQTGPREVPDYNTFGIHPDFSGPF